MTLRERKKEQSLDLLTILAFMVVARISCPALSNLPIFTMAFTFVYGVSFLCRFLIQYPKITRGELKLMAAIALYTIYVAIQSILSGRGLFATDAFNAYVIVFLTVIYLWTKRQSVKRQKHLLILILSALIFTYVYSIWVLHQDPNASRTAAATSVLEKSPYDVLNAVGSFDAVYGGISVVTILLSICRCVDKGDKRNRLLWCMLALALIFIYMAAYATALLLLLFSIVWIMSSNNKILRWFLPVALALMLIFHEMVGQWIIELSYSFGGSEIIQGKMLDFGEMLKTFDFVGTYGGSDGRAARMRWSIDTFLQYPIFGGRAAQGAKIGGHSELLDMLGKYGLVGFGMIATYFVTLYREIQRGLTNRNMKRGYTVVMLVWVITAVLNPALYSLQMMPIILMMPLSSAYLKNRRLLNEIG